MFPEVLHVIAPPQTQAFGVGQVLEAAVYLDRVATHVRAAESLGAQGIIVYDFPASLDPWLAAFDILSSGERLVPIVAVHPSTESPASVARRTKDLLYRFGRRPHLNVVAGASRAGRVAAGAPLDRVAARQQLADWVRAFRELGESRVYTPASSLTEPPSTSDCTLVMAKPRADLEKELDGLRRAGDKAFAMVSGFVARPTTEQAWDEAVGRYTGDRRQEIAARMFMQDNASSQHAVNYEIAQRESKVQDECLWYGASGTGIDCPKLVGSYGEVAQALTAYAALGVTELIIDLPVDVVEYQHVAEVLAAIPR